MKKINKLLKEYDVRMDAISLIKSAIYNLCDDNDALPSGLLVDDLISEIENL